LAPKNKDSEFEVDFYIKMIKNEIYEKAKEFEKEIKTIKEITFVSLIAEFINEYTIKVSFSGTVNILSIDIH